MNDAPSQRFHVAYHNGVTVARLNDRWGIDPAAVEEIGNALLHLVKDGNQILLIDFSRMNFFGADLRGRLARIYKELQSRDGRFGICSLSPAMRDQFARLRLDEVILVYDTSEEAIEALTGGEPPVP